MNKFRVIAISVFLLVFCHCANGQGNSGMRLKIGLEWGYTNTLYRLYHFNYIESVDGYRVDENGADFIYYSNGHITASLSLEFLNNWSVGIHSGYMGIYQRRTIVPLDMRLSYYFKNYSQDSWLVFVEAGSGFHISESIENTIVGRLGCGYRVALSSRLGLDFMTSVQISGDHPAIYDFNNSLYVDGDHLRCSDYLYSALNFTIGLTF